MIGTTLIEALKKLSFTEFVPDTGIVGQTDTRNGYGLIGTDILISHISYPSGTVTPLHEHPELRITFVRRGRALLTCQGSDRTIGEGDVITVKAGEKHGFKVLEGPLNITELVI